jgi:conjugative relaxase-like TrwC/TraI family protein
MAWMAMMGADSVAYHFANAAERADDHPARALEYYASRGETPLCWGGSGAAALGLVGPVTQAQFTALYGPGGAVDPTTGERLVRTRRPGMELVIAAHKSVAELGVIGRAEDMHKIMDAERDATLAYLDALTRDVGGRRGRAGALSPTSGLIYASTRHATSRAGDPNPHDHVLIANLLRMGDDAGGWKAATTALWREHLHAATMVGRVAAAREAVRLGYGIEPDDGPSGRLRHWGIAGVAAEAMAVHSKRAAEIEAEMDRLGYTSYRAKGIVARNNRERKRHEPVGPLMARWQGELESVGWPVAELARSVEAAKPRGRRLPPALAPEDQQRLVAEVLAPDGPLAERKVFTRRDVIVAVAPRLFGHDPAELARVADRVVGDPEAVALVAVPSASERPYATATTIAREQAIAAAVDIEVARTDAPAVDQFAARTAIANREAELGTHLTVGQRAAVLATATSGRGVELIVGVAGSGKTTALAALREAFESDGFRVVGTSTSGQAARTLGRAAGIDPSRTLASLTWRLEHGQESFDRRTVVVLDEAAMTDDKHLLGVLHHAAAAAAKVVLVGDHRQLGAVGPGGGFEALVARYGAAVHVLADNVRQRDVAERAALALLRDGDVARSVAWYAGNGRIVVAPDRIGAIERLVEGWADDVAKVDSVAMYAYRRANVAELNRRGREVWRALGRLEGPELLAPGGTAYAVGDRVVTLAPAAGGTVVTSETGTVVFLDPQAPSLSIRMDDDNEIRKLVGPEIGADRLALGYAVTVHRSQGSTVERAHALEDGGGRELAYVKMSRAKQASTVYVVADSLDQATEDLSREWGTDRRLGWVIDTAGAVTDPLSAEISPSVARPMRDALRRGRLVAEREAVLAVVPPDPAAHIRAAEAQRSRLQREREDLAAGKGRFRDHPVAHAIWERHQAEGNIARLERNLARSRTSRAERRMWRSELVDWRSNHATASRAVEDLSTPELAGIEDEERRLGERLTGLWEQHETHQRWAAEHPEASRRLDQLAVDIDALDARLAHSRMAYDRARVIETPGVVLDRAHRSER